MKIKNLFSALLCCTLIFLMIPFDTFASTTDSASVFASVNVNGFIGAIDTPDASAIEITSAEELYAIRNDLYGSYVLMNDIDLSEYDNWSPIGTTVSNSFHGKFDGQGHSISGLYSAESFNSGSLVGVSYVAGLFGVCSGAEIKNVQIIGGDVSITTTSGYRYENAAITSDYSVYAGLLVGYACDDTVIYNCNVSGNVLAKAYEEGYSDSLAGGLVGGIESGIISYSYSDCTVEAYNGNAVQAYDAYAGGLFGMAEGNVIIDRSYNNGNITAQTLDYGEAYAGGLSGGVAGGTCEITNSYNAGQIISQTGNWFCDNAYAGGLAGTFSGSIDCAYNSGQVTSQVLDPYGIGGGIAYAGGICGVSTSSSLIQNSAIVQPYILAASDSQKYQYRISYQGGKSNNITINSVASGSTNDADILGTDTELKTSAPYINYLGWDFDSVWEMIQGYDYPCLKQVDVNSNEYTSEYIAQHLNFINGDVYSKILTDERWAQTYWSEENNLASNMNEKLYQITDGVVDFVSGNLGELFADNNSFDIILADYITDQGFSDWMNESYELKTPEYLKEIQDGTELFIKEMWRDEWGTLSDEDIFWLFHYNERTADEWNNSDFEKHLGEIAKQTNSAGKTLGDILGVSYEVYSTIIDWKDWVDIGGQYIYDLVNWSANIQAYMQTSEEFREILQRMYDYFPDNSLEDQKNKEQLKDALDNFVGIEYKEELEDYMWDCYLQQPASNAIRSVLAKCTEKLIDLLLPPSVRYALEAIGWSAQATWKICEYVTKNGELMYCRELLRANAYFESTMYNTLKSIESEFQAGQTLDQALLFDMAYKFFKETELYSMDICITFCDTYQSSWVQAIKNRSDSFLNSFIEEVHMHKLYLYRAYCHGLTYNLGGKVITVACPTDVYVYDTNGSLAASVENNTITYCNEEIMIYTADAVKILFVPLDYEYTIKVIATDNGSMSYSVSEYDGNFDNIQSIVYSDIEITEGETFTGSTGESLNEPPETYQLTNQNNEVVNSYELVESGTNVPVSDIVLNVETQTLTVGQTLAVSANVIPTNATIQSVIWTVSNPEIADISEDGMVTAKAPGTVIIKAQSLYGGISSQINLTITGNDAVCGDINGDGSIDALDAVYFTRAIAGWEGYQMPSEAVGDINSDGSVDGQDVIYLIRFLSGWENTLFSVR